MGGKWGGSRREIGTEREGGQEEGMEGESEGASKLNHYAPSLMRCHLP